MQFHELTSKYLSFLSSSRMMNGGLLYGVHEQHTENYCRNFTNKLNCTRILIARILICKLQVGCL